MQTIGRLSVILFVMSLGLGCKEMKDSRTTGPRYPVINSSAPPVGSSNANPIVGNTSAPLAQASTDPSDSVSPTPSATPTGTDSPAPSPTTTEVIDTGIYRFLATGVLRHRAGSTTLRQDLTATVGADNVVFNITEFRATGGDKKSNVDDEVKNKIGKLTFMRTPREKVDNLDATYKSLRDFVVFADRSEDRRGVKANDAPKTATFSSPLPSIVIPAAIARYDVLANGPISIKTNIVTGGKTIPVESRLTRMPPDGANIKIILENIVATDKSGELYELLPVSKRVEYTVNTTIKRITSINTVNDYKDDDNNKRYDTTLMMGLCSILRNSVLEKFGACQ